MILIQPLLLKLPITIGQSVPKYHKDIPLSGIIFIKLALEFMLMVWQEMSVSIIISFPQPPLPLIFIKNNYTFNIQLRLSRNLSI